ncbi:PDZ domain-containing protein [Pseudonocardia lacus]|uniref:PDZ domain-containing protein n=1 Tax=Pseudonocardia lacus TaxID=2835865 RepID=UPI001BDD6CAB|nr:PDZ domain-containing protein [Pseudonocardia lacus]
MTTSTRRTVQESYVNLASALLVGVPIAAAAWLMRFIPSLFGATPLVLPLWVVALPVVATVLVWLVMKSLRYPPGGTALQLGLPFLALALGSGIPAFLPAPSAPEGAPAELSRLAHGPHVPVGTDAVVVFREESGPAVLDIDFPEVEAINGLWAYSSGTVTGPGISAAAPDRTAEWGDTITSSSSGDGHSRVTPTMRVELPLTPWMDRTTVPVQAGMWLSYPRGGYFFTDDGERVARDVQLFVAAPGDRAFGEQVAAWRQGQVVRENHLVGLIVIGGIGLLSTGGGLLSLIRAGGRGAPPEVLGRSGLVVAEAVPIPPGQDHPGGLTVMIVLAAPLPGSPAERANVRAGDVLLAVDGKIVEGVEPLRKRIRLWADGTGHRLDLMRDRQPATATLTL